MPGAQKNGLSAKVHRSQQGPATVAGGIVYEKGLGVVTAEPGTFQGRSRRTPAEACSIRSSTSSPPLMRGTQSAAEAQVVATSIRSARIEREVMRISCSAVHSERRGAIVGRPSRRVNATGWWRAEILDL